MRSLVLFLLCCVLAVGVRAADMAMLSGKITNPIADSVKITYNESWLAYEPKTIIARLDSNGMFSVSFPLEQRYQFVSVSNGSEGTELVMRPNDNLLLIADAHNWEASLHYVGQDSAIANFTAVHMRERSYVNMFNSRLKAESAYIIDSFKAKSAQSLQIEKDFLNEHSEGLPQSFKDFWINTFQYSLYLGMLKYPIDHEMPRQRTYNITSYDTSDFIPVLQTPAAFNDSLLPVDNYRYYISNYYYDRLAAYQGIRGRALKVSDSEVLQQVIRNMPPLTAQLFEASSIYNRMKVESYADAKAKLAAFRGRYPNSAYLPVLDERMASKKKVSAGSEEIDFTIKTMDGRKMRLSDLKGKAVYIDFWASWCWPCRADIADAKKLEAAYKGKDVVFVYVSVDDNEAMWMKAAKSMQIDSMSIRDSGGWEGTIARQYGLQAVPAHFLIDKKGRYAVDVAPGPDEARELTNAINKLLREK